MSDAEPRETGTGAGAIDPEVELISRYEVVPSAKADETELYSFRAAFPPPPSPAAPPTPAQQAATARKNTILTAGIACIGGLLVVVIGILISNRQEQVPPFIDLGANNVAQAGLGGRLIVKWDGSAEYELHIDPLVPRQIAGFSAVAGNPPRPFSVDLRLKDGFGSVTCEKEILFSSDPAARADPEEAQSLVPVKTTAGDIEQNMAGTDGLIDEIVVNGQLPCSAKSYKRLTSWDFASSFPPVADQEGWMRHEEDVEAGLRRKVAEAHARLLIPRVHPLPAPIEGDDVIVFDNPSKGTVETKAGRLFFLGKDGLRGRAPGWQVFPAAVHFHCDTRANCVLTRSDASSSLQARLVH
ncbi:MAG TPA: hypothetical protein VGG26_04000 [Terracidiphilus sp.]|jgi:hypothetical protein